MAVGVRDTNANQAMLSGLLISHCLRDVSDPLNSVAFQGGREEARSTYHVPGGVLLWPQDIIKFLVLNLSFNGYDLTNNKVLCA